jgi:hypothetical protein
MASTPFSENQTELLVMFHIPMTNTSRPFNLHDPSRPEATHTPEPASQNPPIRRMTRTPEGDAGNDARLWAQAKQAEEIERQKAAIASQASIDGGENSFGPSWAETLDPWADELAQAQQWLRLAGSGAMARIVVRLMKLEAQNNDV